MRSVILMLICLWFPASLQAQEKGTALKADSLLAEPFADAKKLGSVSKGDAVKILKKSGGWFQVKAPAGEGWVRLLSIRRGEAGKPSTAKELGGVAALSSGRAGTGQIVSTTGVRGLSEEELKSAKFDAEGLKRAERYASSRADAEVFAKEADLIKREVGPLPDPRK